MKKTLPIFLLLFLVNSIFAQQGCTSPVIYNPNPYVLCADNYDGVAYFSLQTKDAEISTTPGIQITYHRTVVDSQYEANPISKVNPYNNSGVLNQTIYVRVVDPSTPACISYTTLDLIVNPKPLINPNVGNYQVCDVNNPGDGIEVFDLASRDAVILNGQNPAVFKVSYYFSKTDAASLINPLPNFYTNAVPNVQAIWYTIQNTVTHCAAAGGVLELVVNPLPVINPAHTDYQLCDVTNPGDEAETFTLSVKNLEIVNGQPSMVSYYLTQNDAAMESNPLPNLFSNVSNPQSIWYNIKNAVTGCSSVGSFNLIVNPLPLPVPLMPYTVCDAYHDSSDGIGEFDLNVITYQIVYQNPGTYAVSYHKSESEASSNSNSVDLSVPYHNTTSFVDYIWLRAANPMTGCFSVMQIELNVEPGPIMPNLSPIVMCDADSDTQDGCTVFDLTSRTNSILNAQTQPASNFVVTYYDNATAASSTGTPIATPASYFACNAANHTVWARIENVVTGCYNVRSFELQVNTPIVLNTPTLMGKCDDDANPNDMYTQFDIASFVGSIPEHDLKFYQDPSHTQEISDPSQYTNTHQGNQTLFVVATNNTTGCNSYRTITLSVLTIPNPLTNPPALQAKDENNPGDMKEVFDLTQNEAYLANGSVILNFRYYPSQADAVGQTNELVPANAALVGSNVWVRVENLNMDYQGNNCFAVVEQPLTVIPFPEAIPDANFEQALIDLGYDTALDGKVDISVVDKITSLDISGKGISDLTGIQNFTSLQNLDCSNNKLTSLEFGDSSAGKNVNASALSSLLTLNCSNNQLSSLDISGLSSLQALNCSNNQLTSLDISGLTSLQALNCSNNQLDSLDISGLTSLQNLDCTSNAELTCITVSDEEAANEKATWLKDETASYSTSCSKLAVELPLSNAFSVKAYPNPFNTAFVIDVNALSHEPVNIKIYDMLGKLVDHMEVNANRITNHRIGQNYPAGIYNIIVTQEDQMKILRVVKE